MMRSRRRAREAALQALYQCDTLGEWGPELVERFFSAFYPEESNHELSGELAGEDSDPDKLQKLKEMERDNRTFALNLISGTISHLNEIDELIMGASTHWSLGRMARVDRNIIRLATFEMQFLTDVPVNVSINEAIEIAKAFGSDDSPMFVNGVLDNIAKVISRQKKSGEVAA